jgi:hypothetical protein
MRRPKHQMINGEDLFIGIDLHKQRWHVTIRTQDQDPFGREARHRGHCPNPAPADEKNAPRRTGICALTCGLIKDLMKPVQGMASANCECLSVDDHVGKYVSPN